MKKKIISILTATAMAVTFIPTFAFATEDATSEEMQNPTFVDVCDTVDNASEVEKYKDNAIVEVVENEEGEEVVADILNTEKIDGNTIKEFSENGEVEIGAVNKDELLVSVNVEEPVSTTVYENGDKIEEYEMISLLVENESGLSTKEYVEGLEEIVDDANMQTSFWEKIIEPAYADTEYQKQVENTKSKVNFRERIIYHKNSKGGAAYTWFQMVRSSAYIKSTTYKVKSLQIKNTCQGFYQSKPATSGKCSYTSGTSKTGDKISSPKTGTYYKLASPSSSWFNQYQSFKFTAKTTLVVNKSGNSVTETFTVTLTP